jgi:hypothetical protein
MTRQESVKKMAFPVVAGTRFQAPTDGLCPLCHKRRVGEPHSFVAFSGGAVLKDPLLGSAGPSRLMSAHLELVWHGAHDEGLGPNAGVDAVSQLASKVRGGLFSVLFCSTRCLRSFLSSWVADLEGEIGAALGAGSVSGRPKLGNRLKKEGGASRSLTSPRRRGRTQQRGAGAPRRKEPEAKKEE